VSTPATDPNVQLESNLTPHTVQFYSDDGFLLDTLAQFVGGALLSGDAAIVIATRAHRDGLTQRLRDRGLDPAPALSEGRFVLADARHTLDRFSVDSWPDAERFTSAMGGMMNDARQAAHSAQRCIAAFGEMVALLWADGLHDAALRLEVLWNQLAQTQSFSLRCAYPVSAFVGEADGSALLRLCAEHSHVIPAETYADPASRDRLRSVMEGRPRH